MRRIQLQGALPLAGSFRRIAAKEKIIVGVTNAGIVRKARHHFFIGASRCCAVIHELRILRFSCQQNEFMLTGRNFSGSQTAAQANKNPARRRGARQVSGNSYSMHARAFFDKPCVLASDGVRLVNSKTDPGVR